MRCNPGEGGLQLDHPVVGAHSCAASPKRAFTRREHARLLPPGSGSGSAGWPCIASDVEVQPWARRAPDWNLLGEINEFENSEDRRSVGRRGNQHVRLRITQVTSRRPACSDAPIEPRQAPLLCCKQSSQRSRFLLIEIRVGFLPVCWPIGHGSSTARRRRGGGIQSPPPQPAGQRPERGPDRRSGRHPALLACFVTSISRITGRRPSEKKTAGGRNGPAAWRRTLPGCEAHPVTWKDAAWWHETRGCPCDTLVNRRGGPVCRNRDCPSSQAPILTRGSLKAHY